jgi:hypothetical protein
MGSDGKSIVEKIKNMNGRMSFKDAIWSVNVLSELFHTSLLCGDNGPGFASERVSIGEITSHSITRLFPKFRYSIFKDIRDLPPEVSKEMARLYADPAKMIVMLPPDMIGSFLSGFVVFMSKIPERGIAVTT